MRARRAWKLCASCRISYVTVEYSLNCPQCQKQKAKDFNFSVATVRNYDKRLWNGNRDEWDWTLIGLWDVNVKHWIIERIYDIWPDELKDIICKEGFVRHENS